MRLIALLFFCSLFATGVTHSQTQINPKIGVESWTLQDEIDLTGQSSHSGQTMGFDVYILKNRLLFAPGFHYRRMSIMNEEEGLTFKLPGSNGVHYFSIPMTFGFQVIDLPMIDAFVNAGGESTFYYSLDKNDMQLDDDQLHGVFASLTGGAQLELFSLLTLDVKYHYALHPIIKTRPDSKLRGWTLAAGVKF